MKIIKGIDDRIQDTINEKPNEAENRLKIRFCFRSIVSNYVAKSGPEAMEYVELGLKLGIDKPDVELEDEEFKKLKEAVDNNPLKWPVQLIGQLYKKLHDAEKTKPTKPELKEAK